ncbi:MAG: M23 family metallopeptidase [Clostridia bacterium]|nr:M23 family metallopeptidase [Clostridia bacterium]
MKNNNEMKSGTKKNIMNGIAYIALSVTVVAVTVGSVVGSFSKKEDDTSIGKGNVAGSDGDYRLEMPENQFNIGDFSLDTPVSDSPSGVDAKINDPAYASGEAHDVTNETAVKEPEKEQTEEPAKGDFADEGGEEENNDEDVFGYGFDGFIKPCSGYTGKEFSVSMPVYSVSMYDYRTHDGIDIVGEVGTPVKASSNGVISEVYNDYLYGTTVVIEHKDGIKTVYSNLSPDLPANTVEGRTVITGEVIAGIGESAMCESAEASHLHFEMKKDGIPVNPEDYFVN